MNSSPIHTSLETPNCPMCGHEESSVCYQWPHHQPMRVHRCRACRFHFLSPRPSEAHMRDTYRADNYYHGDEGRGYRGYAEQERALRLTFARLMRHLHKQHFSGGSLLEVGCGYGYLLAEAQPYFSQMTATDFSPEAASKAGAFARVHTGGLEQIPPHQTFDMVISNHVVEHVHHPHEFMDQIKTRVKPGGRLLLSTPDMGGWWRRAMGSRWPSFKIPEHLLYFDRRSLKYLFEKHGFKDIRTAPYPHAFPLTLVAAKLGLTLPAAAARLSLWIPGTTVAVVGRR